MQMTGCSHKADGKLCPISKTPCLGECIYANILDDISLGIIGLDISREHVFFQNKLAKEIFRGTGKPMDYRTIVSLLIPDIKAFIASPDILDQKVLRIGKQFIGYTIYLISEVYFWVYISDITEKVRLNAIAEAVNTMNNLGYIFSGIRHELGNPINSIKTTMAVFKKNVHNYSMDTIHEFADRVLSDIYRVEVLLKDLRTFSMSENPEMKDSHIPSFINDLLSIVVRDFTQSNIVIKTAFQPSAAYGVFDPRALQHVMLNILTNAADALKGVASPLIVITVAAVADRIVIKVKDNGSGIPEKQKKLLFQPFSTSKSHGTGLGLVIAKKMMFRMDGTIEIESEENVGTTVILTLPGQRP